MSTPDKPESATDWKTLDAAVRRYVRSQVADAALVDDLTQDVLVKLHRHLGRLRDKEKLAGFVRRTARSVVVDHFRRHRPASPVSDELPGELFAVEPSEPDPAHVLSRWVASRVEHLPDRYREVLRRTELEGQTLRQVADALGVPYSTIKSRVQRGRALLHADLLACCAVEVDARGRVTTFDPRPSGCACASRSGRER